VQGRRGLRGDTVDEQVFQLVPRPGSMDLFHGADLGRPPSGGVPQNGPPETLDRTGEVVGGGVTASARWQVNFKKSLAQASCPKRSRCQSRTVHHEFDLDTTHNVCFPLIPPIDSSLVGGSYYHVWRVFMSGILRNGLLLVGFFWACGGLPAVGQSIDDLFGDRLDPFNSENDLGFQLDGPQSEAEEVPEPLPPGVAASLIVPKASRVDLDGWIHDLLDRGWVKTRIRARLNYHDNGKAYWTYRNKQYPAASRYDDRARAESAARRQEAERQAETARQRRSETERKTRAEQERILRLTAEQLLAEVGRISTPKLQQSVDRLPLIIRELRSLDLSHEGFSRLLWATRQELTTRSQANEDFKHVIVLRNYTTEPVSFEFRFASHEPFRSTTLKPNEWRAYWSQLGEISPAIRFHSDRQNPGNMSVQRLNAKRVYSPTDPDFRIGYPYWFTQAENPRFLKVTDEAPLYPLLAKGESPASLKPNPNPDPLPRRLGVQIQSVDVGNGELGLRILDVSPESVAKKAGLEVGDIIVRVDGVRVRDPEQLGEALNAAGSTAKVRVLNVRNQQYVEVQVSFE
jgi:hypothetical protein